MKIKSHHLGLIIFILIFGGIFTSSILNLWSTESSKVPVKFTKGEFAGEYNPEDIRGSYSFGDISSLFEIPLSDLKEAFNIPDNINISSFKSKELEDIYASFANEEKEIGNGSVKIFVALYKGLPIELDNDTYLPQSAVEIIKKNNHSLTQEELAFLESHSVNVSSYKLNSTALNESESTEEHNEDEMIIKGKTTFKEVLDWGLSKEFIEKTINGKISNPAMSIKDYCTQNNISFSTVKSTLQETIDNLINNQ